MLRDALVAVLEQECARDDAITLRTRLTERVFAVVRPPSETALHANQKTDWFVSRVMGWLERRNVARVTREDLVALVDSIADRKR
jgi:hypothetical protein